jgi:hypothetical protein
MLCFGAGCAGASSSDPSTELAPVCTVIASTPTPQIGSMLTLSATCSNAPSVYTWSGCSSQSNSCSETVGTTGSKSYAVVAENAAGRSAPASVRVDWVGGTLDAGAAEGGTDAGGTADGGTDSGGTDAAAAVNLCAAYADVVQFQAVPYNDYTRRKTSDYGGFPPDRVFVLAVPFAAVPASYASAGYTSMAEYQGPPTFRHMTLSTSPCDFRPADPSGVQGPLAESAGTATIINWNVGGAPLALKPGKTYYFNYKNLNCAQTSCDASTSINWPF